MSASRNLAVLVRATVLLAIFATGTLLGTAVSGAYSAATAQQPHSCEEDHCSGWWLWERCRSNEGNQTACDVDGRGCETKECDA